ncbi:MAG: hypothetical protein AAFR61_05595 [Bacteroidota bacterium]
MKNLRITCSSFGALILVCLFGLQPLLAQDDDTQSVLISIDYMKTTGDGAMELEEKFWKPIHAERQKQGKLLDWGLMRRVYPYGSAVEYDYITINVYKDLAQAEMTYDDLEAIAKKVHPSADIAKKLAATEASRKLVKGEVFYTIARTENPDEAGSPVGDYIVMNHMQSVGSASAYVKMEMDLYRPVHQEAVNAGRMQAWFMMGRAIPGGSSYGYNYITMDVYKSLEQYPPDTEGLVEKAHKDEAARKKYMETNPNKHRKVVRADMYQMMSVLEE